MESDPPGILTGKGKTPDPPDIDVIACGQIHDSDFVLKRPALTAQLGRFRARWENRKCRKFAVTGKCNRCTGWCRSPIFSGPAGSTWNRHFSDAKLILFVAFGLSNHDIAVSFTGHQAV